MAVSLKAKFTDIQLEEQLIEAASNGRLRHVKALLECGTSVDAVGCNKALFYASKNYFTPLQMACKNGHTSCAKVLIANGADVNAVDRFGVTAMHMAAEKNHLACVAALIIAEAACSPPTKFSKKGFYTAVPYCGGTTPLHLAAANNSIRCVEELMQYGGDYNAVDELGRTSLYVAAEIGLSECVLAHLKNAVGRNILSLPGKNTGDTPLHFAVSMGLTDCVSALLECGSDANHKNSNRRSPLHLAVSPTLDVDEEVSMEILRLIVTKGHNTNVNLVDNRDLTPIHYVCFDSKVKIGQRPDMAKFLISYGANPFYRPQRKYCLLEFELNTPTEDTEVLEYMVRSMSQPPPLSQLLINQREPNREFEVLRDWMRFDYFHNEREMRERNEEIKEEVQGPSNVDAKQSYYETIASQPRTLKHFCRYSIRQALGCNVKNIKKLGLPDKIESFLFLEIGD